MRRGILYIVLIGACVYIGIINKEKSYFFAAVIMTAVMLSLIAGLIVRYIRTSVKMQMNIPVVEKYILSGTCGICHRWSGTPCGSGVQCSCSGYEEKEEEYI